MGEEFRGDRIYMHTKLHFQSHKVILEHIHDFITGGLLAWNSDTIYCMRSEVDHVLELWMFKDLNWLCRRMIRSKSQL
jgi:hypothetical protein